MTRVEHVQWEAGRRMIPTSPEQVEDARRYIRRKCPQDAEQIIEMVCTGVGETYVSDSLLATRIDK